MPEQAGPRPITDRQHQPESHTLPVVAFFPNSSRMRGLPRAAAALACACIQLSRKVKSVTLGVCNQQVKGQAGRVALSQMRTAFGALQVLSCLPAVRMHGRVAAATAGSWPVGVRHSAARSFRCKLPDCRACEQGTARPMLAWVQACRCCTQGQQAYPEVRPVVEGSKVDGGWLVLGGEVVASQRRPAVTWVGALRLHSMGLQVKL